MPRLNDVTDITLTGIRGGAASNWKAFSLHTTVNTEFWKFFKIGTTPRYFDPAGYNSTYDGTNHIVISGTNADNQTRFGQLIINDITEGTLALNTDTITTDSAITRIISFAGIAGTSAKYYFACARTTSTTNQTWTYGAGGQWPTVGFLDYTNPATAPTITKYELTDSVSGVHYKVALTGSASSLLDIGNAVQTNNDGTIVVAAVMPLDSTTQYGIMYSTDSGATWKISDKASDSYITADIIFVRDKFYALYNNNSGYFYIYSSTDGSTWTSVAFTTADSGVYNRLHYVGGNFVLLDTEKQRYKMSSDLTNWSNEYYVPDNWTGAVPQNTLVSFEGAAVGQSPGVGDIAFTTNFTGDLSGKTGRSLGWVVDAANKKKPKSGISDFAYHAERISGTYTRAWYMFDIDAGSISGYVNTKLADITPTITDYGDRFSAWQPVTQVNSLAILSGQTYSRQNPYSKEVVSVNNYYDVAWNNSYKNWRSDDMLNWSEASSIGYSGNFSLFEPNQTTAAWLVCVRSAPPGSIKVSSTGLSGSFTTATIPNDLRISSNGINGHAVGVGNTWMVSAIQESSTSQWKILYSTDGGANFSLLSGTPSNSSRPFAVGYANGYWFYWLANGNPTGFYYSTDLTNWTYNSGTQNQVGGYGTREIKYINGRYTFIAGTTLISHTDITATTGWNFTSLTGSYLAYDNNYFVTVGPVIGNAAGIRVYNASGWNGQSSLTNTVDATNDMVEIMGQLWTKTSNDNGIDGYSRPYYLNGYWYVTTSNGMIYRIKHNRLVA